MGETSTSALLGQVRLSHCHRRYAACAQTDACADCSGSHTQCTCIQKLSIVSMKNALRFCNYTEALFINNVIKMHLSLQSLSQRQCYIFMAIFVSSCDQNTCYIFVYTLCRKRCKENDNKRKILCSSIQ